jgi:transposase
MSGAVRLRDDFTAVDLRRLAKSRIDPRQIRRLLALAGVYDGMKRSDAVKIGGMDRQTLRDWVHRFNEDGPDGLINRKGSERARRLTEEQMHEFAQLVETGPDPDTDGVVRWRRVDLQQVIENRFGVAYNERTISKLLVAMGFSHMSARPLHPAQNTRMVDAFKKTLTTRCKHTKAICHEVNE